MGNDLEPLYKGLEPAPNTEYGQMPWSWFARNVDTGERRFAMPESIRTGVKGILDLMNATQTGSLTPEAMETFLTGGVGTGGVLGARGSLGAMGSPIRAYHGSPHQFEKFSTSKIGTGEGAQAYGHGLYFAENEDVARAYRKALTRGKEPGHMYEVDIQASPSKFLDWDKPLSKQPKEIQDALGFRPTTTGSAAGPRLYSDVLKTWIADTDQPINRVMNLRDPQIADALKNVGVLGIRYLDEGSRVAARMNVRDLPGWKQTVEAADKEIGEIRELVKNNLNNKSLLPAFFENQHNKIAELEKRKATALDRIKQIEEDGDLSRNYVVFDEDMINVLRRYGILPSVPVAPVPVGQKPTVEQRELVNPRVY